MKSDFAAQYKHPLWQKRRLEALSDAGFQCSNCGEAESTLHVHHKRYVKDRKIWEYRHNELEVLCEPCHARAHAIKDGISEVLTLVENQGRVLSMLRGYARNDGPFFDGDGWDVDDPWAFHCGYLAGRLMDDDAELQIAIAKRMLKYAKTRNPQATLLHKYIADALVMFKKASGA